MHTRTLVQQSTLENSPTSPTRSTFKKAPACAACLVALVMTTSSLQAAIVNTFADIQLWTGSGANQAALTIDWADGQDALVWGYRFDSAKASDMIRSIVESDPRLFAKIEQFGFGQFVHGLGYDRDGDGFSISSGTNFGPTGFTISGARDGATASDVGDSYRETDTGFSMTWSVWTGTGNSYPGAGWNEAQVGISDLQLANQSWVGARFNTPGTAPGAAVAAVPEPQAVGWLAVGLAFFRGRRRSRT